MHSLLEFHIWCNFNFLPLKSNSLLGVPYLKEKVLQQQEKCSKDIRKFAKVHLDIVREFRILKRDVIFKILKCIMKVDSKHFLWSFFDYCSNTAAFSKIFSVVEVPVRWLSWEPNSVYCSSGTILLYPRNLSKSCAYISKASLYIHSNPPWLVLGRNQLYGSSCSN